MKVIILLKKSTGRYKTKGGKCAPVFSSIPNFFFENKIK